MMEKMKDIRSVGKREKIPFKCTACGACCKNVRDSIMLEPLDAYRLIRHFREEKAPVSPEDILSEYADLKLLSRGYWVYVLKTINNSGICVFLKDDKCGLYVNRPRTCRIYPFTVETYENSPEFKWFLCTEQAHHFRGPQITPQEWQRCFLSKEEIDFLKEEAKVLPSLGRIIRQIPDSMIDRAEAFALSFTYLAYDFDKPFLPQYKENMALLMGYLKAMI